MSVSSNAGAGLRGALGALAGGAVWLAASAAGAEPARVSLAWRAPSGCGDSAAVIADVEQLVRGSPSTEHVDAEAEVTAGEGAVRVHLRTRARGRDGERVVEAASCSQVAGATAVILALMIDPNATARLSAEPEPQPSAPEPVASPVPPSPPVAPHDASGPHDAIARPSRQRTRVGFVASASLAGDVGTLPGASPGAALAVAALFGAYRAELRGAFFPSASGALASRPTAGADFSMFVVGLDGCGALVRHPRARAEICAGLELDRVSGSGFGVSMPESGSTTFGAAALGALLDVPVAEHFSAEVRAGATAPFSHSPFYFEDIGTVHRASPVAGRVAGGVAVHF